MRCIKDSLWKRLTRNPEISRMKFTTIVAPTLLDKVKYVLKKSTVKPRILVEMGKQLLFRSVTVKSMLYQLFREGWA
jgi:hypothetical protein